MKMVKPSQIDKSDRLIFDRNSPIMASSNGIKQWDRTISLTNGIMQLSLVRDPQSESD